MPIPGVDAAEAGMDLVPGSLPAHDIDDEINKTRDYIAQRTSTVQPIAKGGTGAINAPDARTNLGIPAWDIYDTPGTLIIRAPDGLFAVSPALYGSNPVRLDQVNTAFAGVNAAIAGKADNAALAGKAGVGVESGDFNGAPYGRNITWSRRAAWIGDNGQLGYASSRREMKQNFEAPDWTPEQLCAVPILHYRYRAAVSRERRGLGRAAVEIGTIANDLDALGLWEFVIYEGRGDDAKPMGVHYELLGLAALWLAQRAYELAADNARRLDILEGRDGA